MENIKTYASVHACIHAWLYIHVCVKQNNAFLKEKF